MNWFTRWFGLDRKPAPPKPPPIVVPPLPLGLNVHQLTPAALATCRQLGVTQIRTTLYPDAAGRVDADAVDAVYRAITTDPALDLLLVLNGDPAGWAPFVGYYAGIWPAPRVAWQLGNECDTAAASNAAGRAIPPAEYVDAWRTVWERVPAPTRLVTAAVGGDDTALYLRALLDASLIPRAVAVHAYGPPPSAALRTRLDPIDKALRATAAAIPVWCTEFGIAPKDVARAWPEVPPAAVGARIRAEWEAAARGAAILGLARAYGYCLDDDGEGYGIDGTPTADWLRQTQGDERLAPET